MPRNIFSAQLGNITAVKLSTKGKLVRVMLIPMNVLSRMIIVPRKDTNTIVRMGIFHNRLRKIIARNATSTYPRITE